MKRCILLFLILWFSLPAYPTNSTIESNKQLTDFPWAVMGFWGRLTNDEIAQVMAFQYTLNAERLYSLEVSHQLAADNPVRLFFQPLVTTVEVAANGTYRDDPVGSIYEFNPYFLVRWANFPWNKYLATSFAIGEGISYDTQPLPMEYDEEGNPGPRLLNYLMFEATFALPKYPQLELVWRIHHRSGVFGLYSSEVTGSTAVGVGIRYRF